MLADQEFCKKGNNHVTHRCGDECLFEHVVDG
jgi:hypothetical protein